jgi:hypothetical protein
VWKNGLHGYDKLGQIRWLIDKIRENCKRVWKLEKIYTIWWNNNGNLLFFESIYASKAIEVGHQGMVHGLLSDKICVEFCS